MSPHDGRYAPSPSGQLHLGNLRTALIAWLRARSRGASFALRIEDLDPGRSRRAHEDSQRADLAAIGIDWDTELPRQSERGDRYAAALERLREDGRVYECFCTRAEIRAATQAPHGPLPEGSYPGTCRGLGEVERERRRRAARRPPALRLDARAEHVAFEDGVHGHTRTVVDDFVLWRGDGTAAYNLAVTVDDCEQGIGEVVRGADLLDTTPRQILLARLLGLEPPAFIHVGLVVGPDGRRLAKRDGAVTVTDLGPEEARAWIVHSLGYEPGATNAELASTFDPTHLGREPVMWRERTGPAAP